MVMVWRGVSACALEHTYTLSVDERHLLVEIYGHFLFSSPVNEAKVFFGGV